MDNKDEQGRAVEIQSLELMGIFLLFFGILLVVAVLLPMNVTGKIANSVVGILLSSIGGFLFLKGRKYRRKKHAAPIQNQTGI